MLSISVVTPVYNKAPYIAELIRSIQEQEPAEVKWELILVDDGSTDSSRNVCEFFSRKYDNIHYYYKKHSGIANTRNFGNKKAKYNLISVADADDLWLPNRLKTIEKHFTKYPDTDFFYTGIFSGSIRGTPIKYWKPKRITKEWLSEGNQCFSHLTVVYKKDIILKIPYRKEQVVNEDFTLAIDFYKSDYKARFTSVPTVIYRVLPTSVSRMQYKKIRKQCLKIAKAEL